MEWRRQNVSMEKASRSVAVTVPVARIFFAGDFGPSHDFYILS
jgi:hypothetical protein